VINISSLGLAPAFQSGEGEQINIQSVVVRVALSALAATATAAITAYIIFAAVPLVAAAGVAFVVSMTNLPEMLYEGLRSLVNRKQVDRASQMIEVALPVEEKIEGQQRLKDQYIIEFDKPEPRHDLLKLLINKITDVGFLKAALDRVIYVDDQPLRPIIEARLEVLQS
jgi:hypothetical protein